MIRRILFSISILFTISLISVYGIPKSIEVENLEVDSLLSLAHKSRYNNPLLSLKYSDIASKKAMAQNDSEKLADAYNNTGIIYFHWGIYEYAMNYFWKAYNIYSELSHADKHSKVLNNFAICAYVLKRPDIALDLLEKSLSVQTQLQNFQNIADIYNNKGTILSNLNQHELASEYFSKSLNLCDSLQYIKGKAACLNNIGIQFEYLQNLDSALIYFKQAYQITIDAYPDDFDTYLYLLNQARMLQQLNKSNEALQILDKNIDKIILRNFYAIELACYDLYSEIYYHQSNYKKAYEYIIKHNKNKENIKESDLKQKFNYMIVQFQKDFLNKELEYSNQQIKLKRKLQLTFLSLSIVLFIGLLFMIFYIRAKHSLSKKNQTIVEMEKFTLEQQLLINEKESKLKQQALNMQIQQKERKLVSATLNLLNKTETMQQVKDELNKLVEAGQISKKSYTYKQIESLLTNSDMLDKMWNDFFTHFINIYPDFFKKLEETYPQLNSNDHKFCAYIKLNLAYKDIARIYNISDESVKVKKYRLKKKMNLTEGDEQLYKIISDL